MMESQYQKDELFMRRCLQLAVCGLLTTRPNPMVGAVIAAADGRIIGEGFTSPYGGPHAEVNAFASVRPADEPLLPQATLYVSLEPCSHWGHTPPCCDLIIRKGVRRCVCGCVDPFAKVRGRGIGRLREAGIEVTVGVLERECMEMNRRFMTANERHRPFILLKWAQTANGYIGLQDAGGDPPSRRLISTPFTQMLSHKLRAENDAILVGRGTLRADRPRLDVREWTGRAPERIVLTRHGDGLPDGFTWCDSIDAVLRHLQAEQRQSLIVEGGAEVLRAFIGRGLWDEIRVETAPWAATGTTRAPQLPDGIALYRREAYDANTICWYRRG